MTPDPHPVLRAAGSALRQAAADTPARDAEDLDARLETLHTLTGPCLIGHLHDLIDQLAEAAGTIPGLDAGQRELTVLWLGRAAERLGFVGEALDHARESAGAWTP